MAKAYRGASVIKTEFRMNLKMFSSISRTYLLLSFVLFLIYVSMKMNLILFFEGFGLAIMLGLGFFANKIYFYFTHQYLFIPMSVDKLPSIYKSGIYINHSDIWFKYYYLDFARHILAPYFYFGVPGYIVFFGVSYMVFKKKAEKIEGEKILRGRGLKSSSKIKLPKPRRLPLTEHISLPFEWESRNILITGKARSGKTTLIVQMLKKLREEGEEKVIVYDRKGDIVNKLYEEERDLIFNPLDKRSIRWNVYSDITNLQDIISFVSSVIPEKGDIESELWRKASREVLLSIMKIIISGSDITKGNENTLSLLRSKNLYNFLSEHNMPAASFLSPASTEQSLGVLATLADYTQFLEYMPSGDFSIRNYLSEPKSGWIFILDHPTVRDIVRPVFTSFINGFVRALMRSSNDGKRVFLFIDELDSLHKIPSLVDFLTFSTSRGMVVASAKDLGKLKKIYGNEDLETIYSSFGTYITFALEGKSAEFVSENFGTHEVEYSSEGYRLGYNTAYNAIYLQRKRAHRQVILASEIASLKQFEVFLRLPNGIITKDFIRREFVKQKDELNLLDEIDITGHNHSYRNRVINSETEKISDK